MSAASLPSIAVGAQGPPLAVGAQGPPLAANVSTIQDVLNAIHGVEARIESRFTAVETRMNEGFTRMNEGFTGVHARFAGLETRLDEMAEQNKLFRENTAE